jgi:hypothetical protein
VRLIAEELNVNRETVRQIIREDLGMRNFSAKMVPRILTNDEEQRRLHISSDLNAERCLIGSLPMMKSGVFNKTWKEDARACSGKLRIHLCRKSTYVSLAVQDHACVFLRSEADIVHYGFIAQGQTVNQQCSLEVLTRLRESVLRKRPELFSPDK